MWDAWKAGDRKAALAAIPDELVDQLVVHGSPEQCRATIQRYFDNGVTTSSLAIMPFDPDLDYGVARDRPVTQRRLMTLPPVRWCASRCSGGAIALRRFEGSRAFGEHAADLGDMTQARGRGRPG